MKLVQTYKADLLNGEGLRDVYFFSGCEFHCPGCFNENETWDPDVEGAKEWTDKDFDELVRSAEKPYIAGITLSGGDPFHPVNRGGILELVRKFKEHFGDSRTVWCYTGNTWEHLMTLPVDDPRREALNYIDVLCEGPFIQAKASPKKPWVGSENQRVIDVKESLKQGKIVEK